MLKFEEYIDEIKRIALEEGYDTLDETYVEHLRARYFGEPALIGKGSRVILREMKLSDLEAFYEFEDAETEHVLSTFLKETREASVMHLKAYMENMYPLYDYGIWTVVEQASQEIIGLCGLGQTEIFGEICTDLGYYICPKWRKQGLATECIEIVLDYAKNYLEFPCVYAIIKEENRISGGILCKFGFQCLSISDGDLIYQKNLLE